MPNPSIGRGYALAGEAAEAATANIGIFGATQINWKAEWVDGKVSIMRYGTWQSATAFVELYHEEYTYTDGKLTREKVVMADGTIVSDQTITYDDNEQAIESKPTTF